MTLEIRSVENYAAEIIRVPKPHKLPNSDRLYGVSIYGFIAVVDDSWLRREGELAVFFPAEVQLSEGFAWWNNLHRHTHLNANPEEAGYLEDNRRVRAMKLRGNVSSGLLLPLDAVATYAGDPGYREGDRFDHVNGLEICRKYMIEQPRTQDRSAKKIAATFKRVDQTLMPEHIETDQWLRNEGRVGEDDILIVTQKLHGTSARFANTIVKRQLKWWERALMKLGVKVADTEYDTVAGSRRSIKDPNNPAQQHFYEGSAGDIWTDYLTNVQDSIPRGYIIYGEIVGWTVGGGAIQAGHTYGEREGENRLYVYRVATITPDGLIADLSWDQVRKFCATRGFEVVPELWRGPKSDFDLDLFTEIDFHSQHSARLAEYRDIPVQLSPGGTGRDEGIAIRVENGGMIPELYKFKNPSHYLYETEQLDSGEADTESAES